ncbi:MAG TPA: cytochrome c biogenesis protein CcsA [Candidatus Limnocylindria bacterium]
MTTLLPILIIAALATLLAAAAIGIGAALVVIARRAPATEPMITATGDDGSISAAARITLAALAAATVMLAASLVLRAIVAGHAPWSNLHEFSLAFATGLLVAYLLLARTYPIGGLAPLVALLAAGLIGFALGLDDRVDPLVPALQQPLLLTIHVGAAAAAYAVAGVAFLAAAAEIAQRWAGGRMAALPDATTLRVVGHRAVLVAFPILTVAIALGSVWANLAWRSYWSNDPKELAAAATWLVFGAYLHVAGRRDRWESLAPWLIVVGFVGVLFTYIGAGLFIVGEHSYGAP